MNWTIYELLINLFQGFLYTWFITKVLTPSKKYKLYWYIVCSLLTAGSLSTYIFFDMPEWDTWTIVFIICYSIIFFSDSLSKKIFWDMILQIYLPLLLTYIRWKNLEYQKILFIWKMIIF